MLCTSDRLMAASLTNTVTLPNVEVACLVKRTAGGFSDGLLAELNTLNEGRHTMARYQTHLIRCIDDAHPVRKFLKSRLAFARLSCRLLGAHARPGCSGLAAGSAAEERHCWLRSATSTVVRNARAGIRRGPTADGLPASGSRPRANAAAGNPQPGLRHVMLAQRRPRTAQSPWLRLRLC